MQPHRPRPVSTGSRPRRAANKQVRRIHRSVNRVEPNSTLNLAQLGTLSGLEQGGYIRLAQRAGSDGEATITFASPARVEDRRMRRVTLDPKSVTRHSGVTLSVGPHLLLGNVDKPRPVLVARVGRDGNLLLPPGNRFPRVESVDAADEVIAQAAQGQSFLQLAPWDSIDRAASAAFVFDLIAIPE